MSNWKSLVLLFVVLFWNSQAKEQMVDYSKEPYESLTEFFGKGGVQTPDACGDKLKHVTVVKDQYLNRNTFVYTLHKNSSFADDDRCTGDHGRQRVETSVTARSQTWMQGRKGSIFTYAWKVFVPADFVTDGKFCHLHQIKLDGPNTGDPNMTLTARKNTINLENEGNTLVQASLSDFIGHWIQIREKVTYDPNGCVTFTATKMHDGSQLMHFDKCGVKLNNNGQIIRPKFGFYRSLTDSSSLKTESVRIVDICIGQGDSCKFNRFGEKEEVNLQTQ